VFGYFDTILYKINKKRKKKKSRVSSCLGEYWSPTAGLSMSDGVQLMVDNWWLVVCFAFWFETVWLLLVGDGEILFCEPATIQREIANISRHLWKKDKLNFRVKMHSSSEQVLASYVLKLPWQLPCLGAWVDMHFVAFHISMVVTSSPFCDVR